MNAANLITLSRIPCSLLLLLTEPYSFWFGFLYLASGFSDMIDGAVARWTKTVSVFGAKLDTTADFCFVLVVLYKLLPFLELPRWLLWWVGAIAFIKIGTVVFGFWRDHRLVSVHSSWNKVTGFLLFLLPVSLSFVDVKYSGTFVSLVATMAALHEAQLVYRRQN